MRTKLMIIVIAWLLIWPSQPWAEKPQLAVDSATHNGAQLAGVSAGMASRRLQNVCQSDSRLVLTRNTIRPRGQLKMQAAERRSDFEVGHRSVANTAGQEPFLLRLDPELALSTSANDLLDDFPPAHSDWMYWEEENRSGYDILVPSTTVSGWWRDMFLFSALDDFDTRVDRYRKAFVVALMQPELTARLKIEAYLSSELHHLVDLTLSISDLDGDLLDLLNAIENGGTYQLNPAEIEVTLDVWQGFLANEYLNGSLASLGGALGDVSFLATLASDALKEIFLHAIANSMVLERIAAFDEVFQQYPQMNPAMYQGYIFAKDDVNQFLGEDYNAFKAVIDAFEENGAGYVIPVGELVFKLAVHFELISSTLAASIVEVALPYYLAYQIGLQILTEKEQMQVMCADATVADWLFIDVIPAYDLPDPTSPAYPGARRTLLNVMQVRYALAYSAQHKYDEILAVNWSSPADWIQAAVLLIGGSWGSVSEFRMSVLQESMERNLGWADEIAGYLLYDVESPPQVISHTAGSNVSTNIYITFDKDINQETCNNSTISVVGSESGTHSNSFVFDHSEYRLTIDPDLDFAYDDEVAVNLSTGVQDLAGNALDEPYSFSFEIQSAPGYVVAAWAGQNGSVNPDEPWIVTQGGSAEFLASPSEGYEVDQWFLDGIPVPEVGITYTIDNVQSCHFVVVTFKLASGGEITVTSPNGGEVFALQSKMPITWTWTGSIGDNVEIVLYRGGVVEHTVSPSTPNYGSFCWTVPNHIPLDSNYRIRVSSFSCPSSDSSDGEFEIVEEVTVPDVIEIRHIDSLQAICSDALHPCDGHYVLMNDIDASGFDFQPIGSPGSYFEGILDGNGFSVQYLEFKNETVDYVGLFEIIDNGGVVRNLTLKDPEFRGNKYVGAFAGRNTGSIVNCSVEATSSGGGYVRGNNRIGGIAGENTGTISHCTVIDASGSHQIHVRAEVSFVGGIAGVTGEGSTDALVEFCLVDCDITGKGDYTGGIAGANYDTIRGCGYEGTCIDGSDWGNGGIVGWNRSGVIENCSYAGGNLLGGTFNGGIAGWFEGGSIEKCYAAGAMTYVPKGGLAGRCGGTISNSFWDTQVTGCSEAYVDGSCAIINSHGETTSEMKKQATFTTKYGTDWDFQNVWVIDEGVDYPRLRGAGQLLSAPDGLTASTDLPDGVHMSWNAVLAGNTYEAVYRIYRSSEANEDAAKQELGGWQSDRSFIDETAIPEETYFYWVKAAAAMNGVRAGEFSEPAMGIRTYPPAPTPGDLDASDELAQCVLIEWNGYDANYYRVYRSTSPEGDKTPISSWQTRTSYVDDMAGKGTEYFYWVGAALDDTGFAESELGEPDSGSFVVLDETPPELSVYMTPASPIETQVGTLHVSAWDNDVLKQITLHWRSQDDSSRTWDDIGAQSCSLSHVIGVLSAADSITYWAEAWDSTDNRAQSEQVWLIVHEEVVAAPSRPEGPHYLQASQLGQYLTGGSTTSLGNAVQYRFDWADEPQSAWNDSIGSKSWASDGTYFVKAQAHDLNRIRVVSLNGQTACP